MGAPGRGPGGRPWGGPPRGMGLQFGLDVKGGAIDAAAGALGLSRDDLVAKLKDGKSIADVAKDQNTSVDDVKTAVTAAVTKELDQRVKDGKLTSDQRDKLLTGLKDRLDDLVNLKPPARPKDLPAH